MSWPAWVVVALPLSQVDFPHLRGIPGFDLPLARTAEPIPVPDLWQSGPSCGANCVYVLLNTCGLQVKHADILKLVPSGSNGASMLDMKHVLCSQGLHVDIRMIDSSDLNSVSAPFIARLKIPGAEPGHFVVVFSTDSRANTVSVIDGTSGSWGVTPTQVFAADFTGQIITVSSSRWYDVTIRLLKSAVWAELALGALLVLKLYREYKLQSRLTDSSSGALARLDL